MSLFQLKIWDYEVLMMLKVSILKISIFNAGCTLSPVGSGDSRGRVTQDETVRMQLCTPLLWPLDFGARHEATTMRDTRSFDSDITDRVKKARAKEARRVPEAAREHSRQGECSSILLERCEWDEVRTNVDIHTLVRKSSIIRQAIRDILVSFALGLIYRHVYENFETRWE